MTLFFGTVKEKERPINSELEAAWLPDRAWLLIALAASLLLYAPILLSDMPFLCDDYAIIATHIENGRLDGERMADHFTATYYGLSGQYYRPIFYLSYAFDFLIGGSSPFVYYLTNVLCHGVASFCLFLFLRLLGAGRSWSVLAMAVFLSHPIHIEAVAWIAGRTSSLAGMFYLAALAAFACYRRYGGGAAILAMAGFAALGLLTREEGVVLPVLMGAADCFFRPSRRYGTARSKRGRAIHLAAPYAVLLLLFAGYFIARTLALGQSTGVAGALLEALGKPGRFRMVVDSLSRYFLPVMTGASGSASAVLNPAFAFLSIALLALGLLQLKNREGRAVWLLGLALFFFASLPRLPILRINADLLNSRCFYFPSAGLAILLAACAGSPSPTSGARTWSSRLGALILWVAVAGGSGILFLNQGAYVEAGKVCKSFLHAVRHAGFPVMVAPRMEYFPYADQEGDGVWNDGDALFVPKSREAGGAASLPQKEPSLPGKAEVALLLNVPRVVRGVYVVWGGLGRALLPLFGEPGVDLLFSEMYTEKEPEHAPEGSLMGPLIKEGVPVLKWDGKGLVRTSFREGSKSSAAGREIREARAVRSLGEARLRAGRYFEASHFSPVISLPLPEPSPDSFRYRFLTPFGAQVIEAVPREEEGELIFDPWNEETAGWVFRAAAGLKDGLGAEQRPVYDFDCLYTILYIEGITKNRVTARSFQILLRLEF